MHNLESLVPGISKHPSLESRLRNEIADAKYRASQRGRCSNCDLGKIARRYRTLILRRDK